MPPRSKPPARPIYASYTHGCDVTQCPLAGEYRAPRSRRNLQESIWLCLDHVREYNKAWDYFDGMDTEQIEAFRKEAVTGHRPTWKISEHNYTTDALEAGLAGLFGERLRKAPPPKPRLSPKEHKALALFDFEEMPSLADLKKRYKQLVKRTHPDLNQENPAKAEAQFKQIVAAYKLLTEKIGKPVA